MESLDKTEAYGVNRLPPGRCGLEGTLEKMKNIFITFEGIEGSGKTTQAGLAASYLESRGVRVAPVREPGGTPLGEKVRALLVNSGGAEVGSLAELFLYEACRAQVVEEVIRPALDEGAAVVCDRFTDSTVAYQGYGRGLVVEDVERANRLATGGLVPDLTVLVDCPPEVGLARAWDRIGSGEGPREDRFEKEALEFHSRVREGYLELAGRYPERIEVVDGEREISVIHAEICDIIEKRL